MLVAAGWLLAWVRGLLDPVPAEARSVVRGLGVAAGVAVLAAAVSPYAARALTWGSIGFFGAPVWLALVLVVAGVMRVNFGDRLWAWTAGALSFVAVALVIAVAELLTGRPITGGFNTASPFAAVMVAATPMLAWLASAAPSRWQRRLLVSTAAGAVALIVAAGSASGMLGLGVALAVILATSPASVGLATKPAVTAARVAGGAVAVMALAALAAVVGNPAVLPNVVRSYLQTDVFGVTYLTRVEMWKAAAAVAASRPVLGTGPDTYHVAAQPFLSARLFALEPAHGITAAPPDPHSWVATVGTSFGLLGLATFVGVAAMWVMAATRRRPGEPARDRAYRMAAFAGTVGFFAALATGPWAVITGGFPLVLAGLAVGVPGGRSGGGNADERARASAPRGAVQLAGVALALALLYLAFALVAGVAAFASALRAPDAAAAVSAFERAAALLPTNPAPRYRALHAVGSQLGPSQQQVREWQEAVDADPDMAADATYLLMLVRDGLDQAYRWGRRDVSWEAARLAQAAARFPNDPDTSLEWAHLALVRGDGPGARDALGRLTGAAQASSRYDLYRYYLAVLENDETGAAALRKRLQAEYGPLALLEPQR